MFVHVVSRCVAMALLSLVIAGCARRQRDTANTSGVVMFQGKPLPLGRVVFVPQQGRAGGGDIKPDGSFVLRTREPGDGALVGHHLIAIIAAVIPTENLPDEGDPPPQWLIPQHYGSPDTSGLECDIKADAENYIILHLSSEKPKAEPAKDADSPPPQP